MANFLQAIPIAQEWLQDARQAFNEKRDKEGKVIADRIMKLSAEEIARAYNQHLLSKIHSYWDRVRESLGRNVLPDLSRLQQAQKDAAAEASQTVTAQTIWEIYMEAWAVYTTTLPDSAQEGSQMLGELPCWMTTRKYLPPKDRWSDFVFQHLFGRSTPPKWSRNHFLQVYRTGPIDVHLRRILGSCIMIAFNSDQWKEVGTNHTRDTWYHGKPAFFQIQYLAPYFSPPQDNCHIRLGSVSSGHRLSEELSPDTTPRVLTAQRFQHLESVVQQDWLRIMGETVELRSGSQDAINRHCRRALRHMTLLAGPNWVSGERLEYIVPWKLGATDSFRVPIPSAHVLTEGSDTLLSHPTIILPTRRNVMRLFDTIRSFSGLSQEIIQRLRWEKRQLHNNGNQYDLRSHLEAKKEAAELTRDSPSLLRLFLSQTEPPERNVELGDTDGLETESEVVDSDVSETDTESDSPELSDGLASIVYDSYATD
ncbi:hypothetical protein EDB80DRAFT_822164 [Ilyonectria destructans]|nr:hypothetical protein EDB80DRAFT_822164 [Ilyonectria destructans]